MKPMRPCLLFLLTLICSTSASYYNSGPYGPDPVRPFGRGVGFGFRRDTRYPPRTFHANHNNYFGDANNQGRSSFSREVANSFGGASYVNDVNPDLSLGDDVMDPKKVKQRYRDHGGGGTRFNVLEFRAGGNGLVDDSEPFLKAWRAACGATEGTLIAPTGKTFLLKPITFSGPCKSSVTLEILGTLVAPNSKSGWNGLDKEFWIKISSVTNLTIDGRGSGQLDGQGGAWWIDCNTQNCSRPVGLQLNNITNLEVKGTKHVNSAKEHISINNCSNASFANLTILAPDRSPNTGGVVVSNSTRITVQSSTIQTGNDCVAIKSGSSFVNVSEISCGPGHGISVGSLGNDGSVGTVDEVRVQNCDLTGTEDGVAIKTWKGGKGHARRISFSGIRFDSVKNPIVIDQNYCDGNPKCQNNKGSDSTVEVSDITFSNMRGTSATRDAILLNCDSGTGCNNIVLDNINIAPAINTEAVVATCNNVQGRTVKVSPSVPCLKPTFL